MFAFRTDAQRFLPLKRSSIFADDKQPWPAETYKRRCVQRVGEGVAETAYSRHLAASEHRNSVWLIQPNNGVLCARYGTPMQRVVQASLQDTMPGAAMYAQAMHIKPIDFAQSAQESALLMQAQASKNHPLNECDLNADVRAGSIDKAPGRQSMTLRRMPPFVQSERDT